MEAKERGKESRSRAMEVRVADGGAMVVEGYALVFDTPSDGLPFTEYIDRGALDGVLERSDVFALLNHDMSRGVLARCKRGAGSLSLSVDATGLRYSFEVPDTAIGRELAENLRRGEITESSFSFVVDDDTWERAVAADGDGEHWTRHVRKIRELLDVSPVYSAAYSVTSADLRGRADDARAALERAKEEAAAADGWAAAEEEIDI